METVVKHHNLMITYQFSVVFTPCRLNKQYREASAGFIDQLPVETVKQLLSVKHLIVEINDLICKRSNDLITHFEI